MQVNGPTHVHGPQQITAPHRAQNSQPTQANQSELTGVDQLDISHEAELISQIHDIPDIREDRVAAIRAQIEAGTYDTAEKLDIAVDRLLDEIG